jgi:Spy/CpxP family protein refolding chaperone
MNSMKIKMLAISLTLIGLSTMTLTAVAKPESRKGSAVVGSMHEKMGSHEVLMAKELDLTTDQMEKMKAEKLTTEKQNIQDDADMKIMHMDVQAEAMKDNPDMAKLEKFTRKIGDQHAKMMLAHLRSVIFFRSLLTPEQKKKMDQLCMTSGNEMGEGHSPMGMKGERGMEAKDKDCDAK